MSLNLPAAYSSASKLGNIQENWIVQLGFFNGDAQGEGEGGWDAVLQADGNLNLLTADCNTSVTSIAVDDNTVFAVGDYVKIESEIVKITGTAVNGGQLINVVRAQMGTSAESHENDDAIYWNNFTPISLADTTVDSVFYHGVITNAPSIRSSIDLVSSTAKSGNVSLSIINFNYKGDDFSAELSSGTRTYLNRDVRIYIQLNGSNELSDCLHVYTGRLHGIKYGHETIGLLIKSYSPWDRVDFPNTYSDQKVVAPIAFGNFGGHSNWYTNATPNLWRPIPYTTTSSVDEYIIGTDSSSSANIASYINSADAFVNYAGADGESTTRTNVETVSLFTNTYSTAYHLPISDTQASSGADITEDDMELAYDGEGVSTNGTVAFSDSTVTGDIDQTHHQTYTLPQTTGDGTVVLKYSLTGWSTNNITSPTAKISFNTAGGDSAVTTLSGNQASTTITKVLTSAITEIDLEIQFEGTLAADVGPELMHATVNIFELYVNTTIDKQDGDAVYVDVDGTIKNYDSGIAINIHEAHRSLLHGHLGLTDTPTNWSSLNTERIGSPNAWTVLYWQNDQSPIKTLLEKLQYEGCFIYVHERGAGRYIFIADSTTSVATITQDDVSNFTINEVNFGELETTHVINYDPHPARSSYRSQATQTSSNRGDYNFATNENIIQIELEALAASISGGSNRNDDWATYRQKLFGAIRLTVQFDVINMSFSNLETGDIIDFADLPVDPGGGSWSGVDFIVIKTNRSPGKVSITAREVG